MKEVVGQSVQPYIFFSLYRSHIWPHGDFRGMPSHFSLAPSSLACLYKEHHFVTLHQFDDTGNKWINSTTDVTD